MSDNRGFTLVELLGVLGLLAIIFGIVIYISQDTFSTSLTEIDEISDRQISISVDNYIIENNISFNDSGYVCVLVKDLIDYGYLNNDINQELVNKIVKVTRDINTKVIVKHEYVSICE